ncbi:VOC family protein [Tritonibacter mobilis]|uniref:VOC family protein n=1 Tax=Tritonibacter mobilis TaxID=379347 RepID=UPI003BAAA336
MRLSHISLTARDAAVLGEFYAEVFGYRERRPAKRLSGASVSRGNGLKDADIYSIWLALPDDSGPFLEILEYTQTLNRGRPEVNAPGFGHLAFVVNDLNRVLRDVLRCGGAMQGEVTNFGSAEAPVLIVYVRDPEGNLLELESNHRP